MSTATEILTFADAETVLATALPGYQARPPQQRLAKETEETLAEGGFLLAQAGTGVGKSLGYLIPAILSGQRVIVATATKALQDQIGDKDLPFLAEHLPVPFTFAILKGRSNYLCLNRMALSTDLSGEAKDALTALAAAPGVNGEQDRMQALAATAPEYRSAHEALTDWKVWAAICSESDDCDELNCSKSTGDYCVDARKRATMANVVVANHALLVIDGLLASKIGTERSMLGEYDALIVDEAHELEAYATNALQNRMTARGAANTCFQMMNAMGSVGYDTVAERDEAPKVFDRAFEALPIDEKWGGEHRIYHGTMVNDDAIAEPWADAYEFVTNLALATRRAADKTAPYSRDEKRLRTAARKGEVLRDKIRELLVREDSEVVRWSIVEERGRSKTTVLYSAPINPGDDLRRLLWDCVRSAVLTSATVTVNGSMDHVASRLGFSPSKRAADEGVQPLPYATLDVGTPFDYASNAVLYVPKKFPAPSGQSRGEWQSSSIEEMRQLVTAAGGRALLLFTSVTEMRSARKMLSRTLDFPMKMQGDDSTKALAKWFEENEQSVLLATRTFFTGVDFKGDTLRLVVLNKVPFPRYGEPLSEARQEATDEIPGKNGFSDYYVPEAILPMKQAFGRLIRTHTDKGVVAVLDSRIHTKGYGKAVLNSMPPAARVTTADGALNFLRSL